MENEIKDLALTGEEVAGSKSKQFKIVSEPEYRDFLDLDDPKKEKKLQKLALEIEFDGSVVQYLPNRTSQKTLVQKFGRKFKAWVGKTGEFVIGEQPIRGVVKKIIFVKQ